MGYKTDAAKGIGAGWVLVIILGVLAVVTGAIFWGIGVATSGIKGQGDIIKQNNSAENIIENQKFFEEKFEAVKVADQKIAVFTKAVEADPKDKTAQTNLTGMTSQCLNYIAEYNAKSKTILAQDWKSADLPYQINTTNPATDCK